MYQVLIGDISSPVIDLAELFFTSWAVMVTIFMSCYIKDIKVTEENILIGSFKKETILNYKDIEWTSQSYIGRPSLYIKYQDQETGKSRLLVTVLQIYNKEQFSALLFHPCRELNVTSYIRTRIQVFRREYTKGLEPSQWIFFWLIISSLIPFLLINAVLL